MARVSPRVYAGGSNQGGSDITDPQGHDAEYDGLAEGKLDDEFLFGEHKQAGNGSRGRVRVS
jgi:hypothetical protein